MCAARAVQLAIPFDDDVPTGIAPGPQSRLTEVAAFLRAHPGEWRQVAHRPTTRSAQLFASDIRRGRPLVMAGMLAKVRRGYEVWACYPTDDGGEL